MAGEVSHPTASGYWVGCAAGLDGRPAVHHWQSPTCTHCCITLGCHSFPAPDSQWKRLHSHYVWAPLRAADSCEGDWTISRPDRSAGRSRLAHSQQVAHGGYRWTSMREDTSEGIQLSLMLRPWNMNAYDGVCLNASTICVTWKHLCLPLQWLNVIKKKLINLVWLHHSPIFRCFSNVYHICVKSTPSERQHVPTGFTTTYFNSFIK